MIKKLLDLIIDSNIVYRSKRFRIYREVNVGGASYRVKKKSYFRWEMIDQSFFSIEEAERWILSYYKELIEKLNISETILITEKV